jgi:hypothetical protein
VKNDVVVDRGETEDGNEPDNSSSVLNGHLLPQDDMSGDKL